MFVVLSLLGIHIHFDRSPGYDDLFHHVEVQYMLHWVSCASCHKQVGATGLQTLVGCYSESTGVQGFGMHHSTNPPGLPRLEAVRSDLLTYLLLAGGACLISSISGYWKLDI